MISRHLFSVGWADTWFICLLMSFLTLIVSHVVTTTCLIVFTRYLMKAKQLRRPDNCSFDELLWKVICDNETLALYFELPWVRVWTFIKPQQWFVGDTIASSYTSTNNCKGFWLYNNLSFLNYKLGFKQKKCDLLFFKIINKILIEKVKFYLKISSHMKYFYSIISLSPTTRFDLACFLAKINITWII